MKKGALSFIALLLVATTNGMAESPAERLEESPRHHEWKTVESEGGRKVRCFVVFPEVADKATTVVVIHENRGLNDWARSFADQLAEAGYLAVAPDLLSETAPNGGGTEEYESSDAARNGIYKLPAEQVGKDLDAVISFASEQPAGNGKVAAVGFCWGGGQCFTHAATDEQVKAACVFYGSAPREDAVYQAIKAPVYGFYGGNDHRITGAVPEVKEKMEANEKPYDPVSYEGAGHAFMRRGEQEESGPNHTAREEAWTRLKGILDSL